LILDMYIYINSLHGLWGEAKGGVVVQICVLVYCWDLVDGLWRVSSQKYIFVKKI
jgi:hypothetical protein